jgi:hypothetical protein
MEFNKVYWDMYKAMERRRAFSCDPIEDISFDEGEGRD